MSDEDRMRRLTLELTHEFCRMLRHRISELKGVNDEKTGFKRYLEKIQVFISHSKHDRDGESVGRSIRDWIYEHNILSSFFDVYDIPSGMPFGDVLRHQVGTGTVLAVHTDSYSSREWCRREVIEAKRRLIPMVVADCMRDIDPRAMAYLGNVPVVRMEPDCKDRIATIIGCLLDELFHTWLWLCQVGHHLKDSPDVVFTARPPELITLATSIPYNRESISAIVYPEPLLSVDEERLFREIAPGVRILPLTDWLEERQ